MQSNMLSAKKIKVHGMQSRRWRVTDKITQYKGLVNLYARDRKILDNDTSANRKKLKREIKKLRSDIDIQRDILDNAIHGDRQRLRNTLSDNRNLQLAYQNMPPTKVIDVLNQENFNRRKILDRVSHLMKVKTQELINLKLEYADLEDRIKYESKEKIPEEEVAQMITCKVQDAILKNETAMDVQNTYKQILTVLKKDAIYFDAVLRALQVDGYNQGKCILKITEMGQMATEYLDDRKDEYKMLETTLKTSMQQRDNDFKEINDKLKNLKDNVKYLIRKDSVIILDDEKRSKHTNSEIELMTSVQNIEFTLNRIKEIAEVSKIEDIFPRIEDQRKQRQRLEDLVAKNTADRNTLLEKSKHAEAMYNNLCHTMVETTMWYKDEKERITSEINVAKYEQDMYNELILTRGETFLKIRTALQQLAEILRNVKLEQPAPAKKEVGKRRKEVKIVPVETVKLVKPEKVEEDATILLDTITKKLQKLVGAVGLLNVSDAVVEEEAEIAFEKFVTDMIVTTHVIDTTVKEESLIDDVQLDDPQVPSRLEIKTRSAYICEKFAKPDYEL